MEKADRLVGQNDEQASGFFDRGRQHTEEVTAAEIEVVLMTATNEVEIWEERHEEWKDGHCIKLSFGCADAN